MAFRQKSCRRLDGIDGIYHGDAMLLVLLQLYCTRQLISTSKPIPTASGSLRDNKRFMRSGLTVPLWKSTWMS
jgi:hypothetical protein